MKLTRDTARRAVDGFLNRLHVSDAVEVVKTDTECRLTIVPAPSTRSARSGQAEADKAEKGPTPKAESKDTAK